MPPPNDILSQLLQICSILPFIGHCKARSTGFPLVRGHNFAHIVPAVGFGGIRALVRDLIVVEDLGIYVAAGDVGQLVHRRFVQLHNRVN